MCYPIRRESTLEAHRVSSHLPWDRRRPGCFFAFVNPEQAGRLHSQGRGKETGATVGNQNRRQRTAPSNPLQPFEQSRHSLGVTVVKMFREEFYQI